MQPDINHIAKTVFKIEANEIARLADKLTDSFQKAVESIYHSDGKVILIGMGKSGIITKKLQPPLPAQESSVFYAPRRSLSW